MYKNRKWDYQIQDILLTKVDIETGECIDNNIYSYEGECCGISSDINCSDEIRVIDKRAAMQLIEMLQEKISEEDPADRDDRLYHEEQDHIAMGIAKES